MKLSLRRFSSVGAFNYGPGIHEPEQLSFHSSTSAGRYTGVQTEKNFSPTFFACRERSSCWDVFECIEMSRKTFWTRCLHRSQYTVANSAIVYGRSSWNNWGNSSLSGYCSSHVMFVTNAFCTILKPAAHYRICRRKSSFLADFHGRIP